MELDHVAVVSQNITASVQWYQEHFKATILYQDSTWAFLQIGHGKLALVTPGQHPAHLAVRVKNEELDNLATDTGTSIAQHRDGTRGIYLHDPDGNSVEVIVYPENATR